MSILVGSWAVMSLLNLSFVLVFNASSDDIEQSWHDIPFLLRLLIIFTPIGSIVVIGIMLVAVYVMLSRVLSNE